MKSFLTGWLAETPKVLGRELSVEMELLPSAGLPQPETAATLAITLGTAFPGRFLVSVDRAALHALLVASHITAGDEDVERDLELWRGILRQTAASATQSLDPAHAASIAISVEDAAVPTGLPSEDYELRSGEIRVPLAITDEIKLIEPVAQRAPSRSVSSPVNSARIAPGGIDLLLDVELEASLRFGSREMPLSEVLDLGAGDVVELDRHVSDPVDLLVGDKIVARGEVVLVNGTFGLRVLEVAEPKKCLESIRCLF
ncbi:MAG: FliM/FliN family flagellar motor switch protein [Acidobacteriaceae bacterium]